MGSNQGDHGFKPGRSWVQAREIMGLNQGDHGFKPSFFIWYYVFQENEGDHGFKPGQVSASHLYDNDL